MKAIKLVKFFLFDYDHPFSQQSRITLRTSTWELLDAGVGALAGFLSLVLFPIKSFILVIYKTKER